MESWKQPWLGAAYETALSYRKMIDATIEQLTDQELHTRLAPDFNSVAVILRHLGGNLISRWTDCLASDGEKPTRDREAEFADWQGDRQSLVQYFNSGWEVFLTALQFLDTAPPDASLMIRGEPHTIQQAVNRSVTHTAYHVGQIMLIARLVHSGAWRWLTIAPGKSSEHNRTTWGSAVSRGVLGEDR